MKRGFKVATTRDTEEIGTSSSTVDEICIFEEQESQTIDLDEMFLERLHEQKRFQHVSTLLKNINRLGKTQAEWWEFTSAPDVILQLGTAEYFIEFKFSEKSRPVESVLSEVTTRDCFQRMAFLRTILEEEPSVSTALQERLVEEIISHSRFHHTFAQLLSSQTKRFLAEQRPASCGSPEAVLQAMDASPHPSDEDIDDLLRIIKEQERSSRFDSPFVEQ